MDDAKTIEEYSIQEKDFLVVMVSKPKTKAAGSTTKKSTSSAASATNSEASTPAQSVTLSPAVPVAPQATPNEAKPPTTESTETKEDKPAESTGGSSSAAPADSFVRDAAYNEAISNLVSFGFEIDQVKRAMRAAFNNPDRAAEYLFNGIPAGLGGEPASTGSAPTTTDSTSSTTSPAPTAEGEQPAAADNTTASTETTGSRYVNLFDEAETAATTGTGAANTSGNPLAFLQGPQMEQLRPLIQSNPELLQGLIQQIAQNNPQALQMINEHPQEFLQILAQGLGEEEGDEFDAPGDDGMDLGGDTQYISITPEDNAAIERLMDLGFERDRVIEAFIACEKNEELAANYLFDHGNGDF